MSAAAPPSNAKAPSLKARLRSIRGLPQAVTRLRRFRARLMRGVYAAYRPIGWFLQSRKGVTSERLGTPRYRRHDVFDYLSYDGWAQGARLDVVLPAQTVQHPLPLTVEPEMAAVFRQFEYAVDDPAYVFRLPNGRCLGPGGAVVSEGDVLLLRESYEWTVHSDWEHTAYQRLNLPPVEHERGALAVLATNGDNGNYYHFMLNTVPRVHLLRSSSYTVVADRYYVSSLRWKYVPETFAELGIGADQLVEGIVHPHVKADELLVMTRPGIHGNVPRWAVQGLRSMLLDDTPQANAGERLYISRATARMRRVLNEPEVIKLLEGYGFRPVLMDKLSVREQIETLARADVVVGIHGANMTNIAFCPEGTRVLEIFPRNYIISCYWRVAVHAGLRYGYLLGEGETIADPGHLLQRTADDTVVDLKKLEASLELMGIERAR